MQKRKEHAMSFHKSMLAVCFVFLLSVVSQGKLDLPFFLVFKFMLKRRCLKIFVTQESCCYRFT